MLVRLGCKTPYLPSRNSITGISQRVTSTAGVLAVNVFGRSGGYNSVYASNLGSSPRVTELFIDQIMMSLNNPFWGIQEIGPIAH